VQYVLYIIILVALAFGFCWLNDRFTATLWRWRNPPEKLAADRRAFEDRLLHPDWDFYERHLQRPAPAALRELFADHKLLLTHGCQYDDAHYFSTFEPLDEPALVDASKWIGCDFVPLANSDGDSIYLRPGPSESDAVFITYHDGNDTEELAPDVGTLLRRRWPLRW
jgi:hypothetical protein